MKTQIQTRIGLAVGLILALLSGLAPRAEAGVIASGGNYTNDIPGYRTHVFTDSATASNFVVSAGGGGNVEVLVVAGGGGGGCGWGGGGGGGAGGFRIFNTNVTASQSYPILVGAGGNGSASASGSDGGPSAFGSVTNTGGGGGGGANGGNAPGRQGGSGGGASCGSGAAGDADYLSPRQGYDGGTGGALSSRYAGGGGGGAVSVGAAGDSAVKGGDGGSGTNSSISGPVVGYAGGGGGGAQGSGPAGSATHGGGAGGYNAAGANGTPNTGGGGGAGGSGSLSGGTGGSGIVVVRYAVPNAWSYSMPITFTNDARLNTLTNFPALVILDTNKVNYGQFQANGQDLRFMDGNGAELRYEVEKWMETGGASNSTIWVQIPTMTAGCVITAYWGNASADLPSYRTNGTVWADGYIGVWHLPDGTTLTAQDSSPNVHHATAITTPTATAGKVGGAANLSQNDFINYGNVADYNFERTNPFSAEAWIYGANTTAGDIVGKAMTASPYNGWYLVVMHRPEITGTAFELDLNCTPSGSINVSTPLNSIAPSNWYHVVATYDGSSASSGVKLYINGALQTLENKGNTSIANSIQSTANFSIGSRNANATWNGGSGNAYAGKRDEVRVSTVVRSANWVWACYANQSSPAAFSTYGAVSGDTTSPQIQNQPPTGVTTLGATFNGYLVTNGASAATVYVAWGQTNGAVSGSWAYTNWWNPGDWTNGSYPSTNMALSANANYYYRFGATNSTTNVTASGYQYLITAKLTPTTSDGLCGPTVSDTATIAISRPGTLTNDALVVNYTLSGNGTNYASASPASGFTLAAGEASRNIVFTLTNMNTGAVAPVTLTLLPGAYASDVLGSAQVSVTNITSLTASNDTSIGSAMNVLENPPATVSATGAGPYTYGFSGLNLNLNGKKIYYNTAQRDVVLTNLASVTDSGSGSLDTSSSGNNNNTGYIEIYSSGAVQIGSNLTTRCGANYTTGRIVVNGADIRIGGGVLTDNASSGKGAGSVTLRATGGDVAITNCISTYNGGSGVDEYAGAVAVTAARVSIGGTSAYGFAIDAHGNGAGQHMHGNNVTLIATSGITLSTGGIGTYGRGGGDVSISDGASGSAGDVYVGGAINSYSDESSYRAGAITVRGGAIRITGNLNADYLGGGAAAYLSPILIAGSGAVRLDGYVSASHPSGGGNIGGNHSVTITGSSVTLNGQSSGGYSVLANLITDSSGSDYAGNISLVATAGDVSVAGGFDALDDTVTANSGTVTNIASGNITIGSLNASRFKAITLIAGQTGANWIYVTGVLTNFAPKSESPKKFFFPTGSVVSNDVYYDVLNNGAGLSGTYSIYVGSSTDTGKKLLAGPPGAGGNPPTMVNGAATNQTDTTAGLIGTMASTGTAASVAYVFWSTTDCTNNEAAWLSTGGGVSNLGPRAEGETFTNTVSGLSANTRYYYNHMGSNSVGTGWAATNASPSFWTDGPPGVGTNTGATAIGAYSATLNGALTNSVRARIFVYYGTDYNNWSFTNDLGWRGTGTFSTAASGLPQNTLCYYQCQATNVYGSALSAVASFTTKVPATTNMTGDVYIGNVLAGINAAGTSPYTYDFGGYLTLDMGGYKLYCNDQQRDVRVTNVLAILNGGSVDTSRSGVNLTTGYIEIDSSGAVAFTNNLTTRNQADATTGRIRVNATAIRVGGGVMTDNCGNGDNAGSIALVASAGDIAVSNAVASACHGGGAAASAGTIAAAAGRITVGGTNAYGHAVDAHGGYEAGQHISGNSVTLTATGGVTLSTAGIATYGHGGGAVTISDGAGGSAGDIYVGGNLLSYNNEGNYLPGAQTLIGSNIRVTGYLDADQKGSGVVSPAFAPVAIVGSGSVRVDGYVTSSRTGDSGIMSGDHSVRIQGASVTVSGTTNGYSVLAMNACGNDAADNISVIATAGDITVAGGYDAYSAKGSTFGTVTNIATGKIVIGSLDAARFKAITLQAGTGHLNAIQVTGVITNFPTNASPKKITFPDGSFVGNDIYYTAASNTATGLSGNYAIWVGAGTDTGKVLRDGLPPWEAPGAVFRFR